MARTSKMYLRTGAKSVAHLVPTNGKLAIVELFGPPGTGNVVEVLRNIQVIIQPYVQWPGAQTGNAIKHGFLRWPDNETPSIIAPPNVQDRRVLRTKIDFITEYSAGASPYQICHNFMKAITLSPNDSLWYWVARTDESAFPAATQFAFHLKYASHTY